MTIFGIILFLLILVGIGVWIYTFDEEVETAIFSTIIITLILFAITCGLGSIDNKHEKSDKFGVTYISSLSTNSSLQGNFCLGSGTIKEVDYYYFLVNSNYGYQVSKIEINYNTYVKEDCNTKPFIEFTRYNCVYLNWFSKLIFKKSFYNKDGEIIIHVPKNTVIKNYNVDISKL